MCVSDPRYVTFVYEGADVFDAMVGAFVRDDGATAYLVGMWVAPDLRASGVASQLVERVVAWARGRGCSRVVLSVEGNNARAARLYEKCGSLNSSKRRHFPTSRALAIVSMPTHCEALVADGGPESLIFGCGGVREWRPSG
jgi:ribosomal protein S18 acetylase RimI-like enzyme